MWAILCEVEDESALALAVLLEKAGLDLTVLCPEHLVRATHSHRVGADGVSASVRLRDGAVLDPAGVTLLVNRFRAVPETHLARCAPDERDYVRSEWSAYLASLLACCGGPVLNPPFSDSPGGYPPGEIESLHFAALCGLPVVPRRITEDSPFRAGEDPGPLSSHLVVGGAVLPELPEPLAAGARKLAGILGLPLMQVDFAAGPDGAAVFHGCSGDVEFRHAPGAALVEALRVVAGDRPAEGGWR